MSNPQYRIYKSDLKYKANRNLNVDKIIWDNPELLHLYHNVDLDSLAYRLEECKAHKYTTLDLSNMSLENFPEIPSLIASKVQYLFLSENKLSEIPDLSKWLSLSVIDLSNNKLVKLNKLPKSLIELTCKYNNLVDISNLAGLELLERIDLSYNSIETLPENLKVKIFNCSYNKLTSIPGYGSVNKLYCNQNKITTIGTCDNLQYLDCGFNLLKKLGDYPNLVDLICESNPIDNVKSYKNLKYLEIFNTNIKEIPYMPNIHDVFCTKKAIRTIDARYVDNFVIKSEITKNVQQITFNRKN